jgi:hypothetical protein
VLDRQWSASFEILFVEVKDDGFTRGIHRSVVGRFVFVFVKDGIGHDVFFSSPVAQIAVATALTAEREVRIQRRIRGSFADGAFVFHDVRQSLEYLLHRI